MHIENKCFSIIATVLESCFLFIVLSLAFKCCTYAAEDTDSSSVDDLIVCNAKVITAQSERESLLFSKPIAVKHARYLQNFADQVEGNNAYTSFVDKTATRREQLYVVDHQGILNAFNTTRNNKLFTFEPVSMETEYSYSGHSNFVDKYRAPSEPIVADVYDGLEWRTILVNTSNSGKGIVVLDITDPDAIELLWEVRGTRAVSPTDVIDLGYSIAQPTVARLHNGEWAVVVGNGYGALGGQSGAAALYLFNAVSGALIASLEVDSSLDKPNGLSSPRLADYDGDGVADYAYAGDLHGNLWRFDLLGDGATPPLTPSGRGYYGANSGTTNRFQVSYGSQPMFVARATANDVRQPIAAAPNLVRHPTGHGHLVIFGTGINTSIVGHVAEQSYAHSLYGIWDMQTTAEVTKPESISRDQLTLQSITKETTGLEHSAGLQREARIISNHPVEWYTNFDSSQAVKKRGWYLDFQLEGAAGGEMVVEDMRTLGSMILLQTLTPKNDPCAGDVLTWLYVINPHTGGRTTHSAFDFNEGEYSDVAALKFGQPGPIVLLHNGRIFTVEAADESVVVIPPPQSWGRQSWRMLSDP